MARQIFLSGIKEASVSQKPINPPVLCDDPERLAMFAAQKDNEVFVIVRIGIASWYFKIDKKDFCGFMALLAADGRKVSPMARILDNRLFLEQSV